MNNGGRPRSWETSLTKLRRLLKIIKQLEKEKLTYSQIARRHDISERTAYRYIQLFEEVGLQVEVDFKGRAYIITE